MAKIAQRQVLAKITAKAGAPTPPGSTTAVPDVNSHITGPTYAEYFAQVSGGEVTASVERIYVGGKTFPEILCAPAEIGDITITSHYDTSQRVMLSEWRLAVGKTYYTIDVYQTNCDLATPQGMRQYENCLLVGLTEPEGDSSSGAPATFTLTFAVSGQPTQITAASA